MSIFFAQAARRRLLPSGKIPGRIITTLHYHARAVNKMDSPRQYSRSDLAPRDLATSLEARTGRLETHLWMDDVVRTPKVSRESDEKTCLARPPSKKACFYRSLVNLRYGVSEPSARISAEFHVDKPC